MYRITSFSRIVVPVDGSKPARKAAQQAVSLAKTLNIPVIAIHVLELHKKGHPQQTVISPVLAYGPPSVHLASGSLSYGEQGEQWNTYVRQHGQNAVNEIKQMGDEQHVKVTTKIREGITYEEIIEELSSNDLLVISDKGMSAAERFFLGSVTEKVIHHAPSSILLVR